MNECSRCKRPIPPDVIEGACPICLIDEGLKPHSAPRVDSVVAPRPRMREQPGRYEVNAEHARGGQGRLLLVHDAELNRDVIMKELLPPRDQEQHEPGSDRRFSSMASRFLHEAQVTGQLEHPAVVPVHEVGQRLDGTLYYTMKYVRGMSMEERLQDCTGLRDRLALLSNFLDLCQGVAYAHSRGVVHRDLKPQNVMIGEFGETVIIDWGLAKILGEKGEDGRAPAGDSRGLRETSEMNEGHTIEGELIGTPAYMSPEQAAGLIESVDERSDVFALGCLLYRILTGETTYKWTSPKELLHDILNVHPRPIRQLEPDVPPELIAICDRCLEKGREHRYQNAKELATEIERFQTGSLVASYDYKALELLGKFYRRHRPTMNIAMFSFVALLTIVVLAYIQVVNSRNDALLARDESENRAYVSQLRLAQGKLEANAPELAKAILDSTKASLRGWEWGFLANQTDQSRFVLDDCIDADLSPDGSRIVTITQDGPIRIWNAEDGSFIRSIESGSGKRRDILFSPDGSSILSYNEHGDLQIWDTENGELQNSWAIPGETIVFAAFSPSGDRIVCSLSDGVIRIYDPQAKTPVSIRQAHAGTVGEAKFSVDGDFLVTSGWGITTSDSESKRVPQVAVWAVEDLVELWRKTAHAAAFGGGDQIVLAVDEGFEARKIDGSIVWVSSDPSARYVAMMAVSNDHSSFATISGDNLVRTYSGTNGRSMHELNHIGQPTDIQFSANGRKLVTNSLDGPITIFDAITGRKISSLRGHSGLVREVAVGTDSSQLVSSSFDKTVRVWQMESPRGWRRIASMSGVTHAADFSLESNRGLAIKGDGVQVFDLTNGSIQCVIETLRYRYHPIADMSANGSNLAIVCDGFATAVIRLDTYKLLSTYRGHEGPVEAVSVSEDGEMVATASRDGSVHVWLTKNGESRREASVSERISSLVFDETGDILAIGCENGDVLIWRLADRSPSTAHTEHDSSVTSLKFTPDSQAVFSSSTDGIIGWEVETRQTSVHLETPRERVRCLALDTNATRLFVGSGVSSLGVWDLKSGEELLGYSGFSESVVGLEYNSQRKLLYVADHSGVVVELSENLDSPAPEIAVAAMIGDSAKMQELTFVVNPSPNGRDGGDTITLKSVASQSILEET